MKENIALYATGDLPSGEVPSIEHHLNSCAACERYCNEMQALVSDVHEMHSLETPVLNVSSIFDALERPERRSWSWRIPATVAAVAALLIMMNLMRSEILEETPLEFKLTKTAPVKVTQQSKTTVSSTPEIDFANDLVQDVPSMKVILYTDDPNVVIHWFGD